MEKFEYVDLSVLELESINGGSRLSTALGFIGESIVMLGEWLADAATDFVEAGAGNDTLMNCI